MTTATYTQYIPNARVQTYCALGLLVALFAAYIYFLSASVVHVVMRKETMHEIVAVNSELSKLEAKYIAAQRAVNDATVAKQGFVAVAEKVFLERDGTSVALSQRN